MDQSRLQVEPVRFWDMLTLTRMAYNNMTGVDPEFTRYARSRVQRALGYLLLPLYFATAGQGFKATVNDQIAGCAFLHPRQLSGFVFNVSVNERFRRQGVATSMMRHLADKVRARSLSWLGLQVDRDNRPAKALYLKLGYRPYNSYYLHSRDARRLAQGGDEGAALERAAGVSGRRLFQHYADMERREGDDWAAAVVKADYDEGPPVGGAFWRCMWVGEEVGCAWLRDRGNSQMGILCLRPDLWGLEMPLLHLLSCLMGLATLAPRRFDLRFGSSTHRQLAEPLLSPLGFETRQEARILMLKQVDARDAD